MIYYNSTLNAHKYIYIIIIDETNVISILKQPFYFSDNEGAVIAPETNGIGFKTSIESVELIK